MSSLATRRLIDAAATLDPADRALLNLWVNRGLSDDRLTALTGMSGETLQARRQRIVDRLSAELGLPESDVRAGLQQISPDHEAVAAPVNGSAASVSDAAAAVSTNGTGAHTPTEAPPEELPQGDRPKAPLPQATPAEQRVATPTEDTVLAPGEETLATPTEEPSPRRRRGLWIGLLAALVVIIVAVIIAASSSSSPTPAAHSSSTATAPAATTATTTTTTSAAVTPTPTPTHPTAGPVPDPLAGLPGGLANVSGSVKLSGLVKHLKLNLRVKGLPAAHHGHYEVWLYNSVLDSRPLGRLRNGRDKLTVRLPGNARHYHFIDVSFQPVGAKYHSGESELRATNPAHTTKARLRKHAARTRRALHRPGTRAHRRPTAKGSKKSTTSK